MLHQAPSSSAAPAVSRGPGRDPGARALLLATQKIADEVAGPYAAEVDRDARFPKEALAALRNERLLSALVPTELGGGGCTVTDLMAMCCALGQRCAATAMIFAMHHIEVACIRRHGLSVPFFRDYLRAIADQQLLIASVTSEVGVGGSLRTSVAAVQAEPDADGMCHLEKAATTISYGAQADDLLLTARRMPDAPASDQVLLLLRRGDFTLEPQGTWDTLGMRGTCSPAFLVRARFAKEQILPLPFADISAQTMVPFSHLLWGACWLGIATDAVARARALVRGEARKNPGAVPPQATRLAEVNVLLQTLRASLEQCGRAYQAQLDRRDGQPGVGFALKMNNLKIAASQLTVQIVAQALNICGMAGYKSDSKFSLGRHLRDALSAPLMIGNDRIHAGNASLLLVHKDDESLFAEEYAHDQP